MNRIKYLVFPLLIAAALILGTVSSLRAAQNTGIYFSQGGQKMTVLSGAELELQSGAILDLQSGALLPALTYPTTGNAIACGSTTFTGTTTVTGTGVSTVTYVLGPFLGQDPSAGAGAPFTVSYDPPTTSAVTLNSWQDDATAATSGAIVSYCLVGSQ